ncbi:MerR family transcriptional regulator [Sphaerimonospora thailandensis]|uniref:HTH merR-type domain-containing protein n=1 Tax=Sphaerimonospora thailandensis TaxID=795644 RepID=A0A8J3VXP1_9ACTN|nr:MerR family transcriptional regulator [Sphaerimonospora thailandensis]GIH68133.1 hypothetical protein Mth01_03860 [Sphaerimonospora thailandensis]
MDEAWTIGELARRAAALLGGGGVDGGVNGGVDGGVNGRVREVPNERLIRWYTTIGLLDPPLARRGRVAIYGRRHLLQLVAVKRRQADGLSIAAIQAELAGATDAMLQRIADLPADPPVEAAPASRDRFWVRDTAAHTMAAPAPETGSAPPDGVVFGVRLTPGVTVMLDGAGRTPTPDEAAAIRLAAGPLLAALTELGLTREGKKSP